MIGRMVAFDYTTGEATWERDISAIVAYAGMDDLSAGGAFGDALALFFARALASAPDDAARLAVAELAREVSQRLSAYNLMRFEAAPESTNPGPPSPPDIPDDPPTETSE